MLSAAAAAVVVTVGHYYFGLDGQRTHTFFCRPPEEGRAFTEIALNSFNATKLVFYTTCGHSLMMRCNIPSVVYVL